MTSCPAAARRSSACHAGRRSSSPSIVQTSLNGGSTAAVTPEMNVEPVSVWAPTVAPDEPWTWIRPYSPGRCELLATSVASAPFRKRSTATAVSSTGTPGWLALAQ